MPLITILIPCYNEEQSLPALYEALCTICNPLQEVSSSNICEGITPPHQDSYSFEFLFDLIRFNALGRDGHQLAISLINLILTRRISSSE